MNCVLDEETVLWWNRTVLKTIHTFWWTIYKGVHRMILNVNVQQFTECSYEWFINQMHLNSKKNKIQPQCEQAHQLHLQIDIYRHLRHNIVCFCSTLVPNKVPAEPLCVSEKHSAVAFLFLNESAFWTNQWFNDSRLACCE